MRNKRVGFGTGFAVGVVAIFFAFCSVREQRVNANDSVLYNDLQFPAPARGVGKDSSRPALLCSLSFPRAWLIYRDIWSDEGGWVLSRSRRRVVTPLGLTAGSYTWYRVLTVQPKACQLPAIL